MNNFIERLMQPTDSPPNWQELASCRGDLRFSTARPDEETAAELEEICLNCEVFTECLTESQYLDIQGVFMASSWKDELCYGCGKPGEYEEGICRKCQEELDAEWANFQDEWRGE